MAVSAVNIRFRLKRSKHISLVLSGALATGSWAGCNSDPEETPPQPDPVSAQNTYTNNHYVGTGSHGGYYHAPYHSWFPYPYNYYSPDRGYFHGGNWTPEPNRSPIAASKPSPAAAQSFNARANPAASAAKGGSIARGGFGGSSHSSSAA